MRIEQGVEVTPQLAKQWLAKNHPDNRKPKVNKIDAYARDIHNGTWIYPTGELIKFDVDGNLIDGQNRLMAVAEADKPALFDVAWDCPDNAKLVLDSGAGRSFGDALAFRGTRNRNNVGALVRWAIAWEKGFPNITGGHINPTHTEMLKRLEEDPYGFDTATTRGLDLSRQRIGNAAAAGVAFWLFSQIDKVAAHDFFDSLVSGENLVSGNPILTLRNRLIRGSHGRDRDSRQEQLALIIRGWNAWREDRTLFSIIAAPSGRLTNQNFPRPK